MDAKYILSTVDIVDVVQRHGVTLKAQGREMVGLCPFHADTHSSFKVNAHKQIFKCFACGAGGDALNFLTGLGASFKDALEELSGGKPLGDMKPIVRADKPIDWTWVNRVPLEHQDPKLPFNKRLDLVASKMWRYCDSEGYTMGFVTRFDLPDGSKEVLPYIFVKDTNGREYWRFGGFPKPRPLYNLHLLAQYPDKTVIIVEGEKTADACQKLIDSAVVVTWSGGAGSIDETDWSPLFGRKIVAFPDADSQQKYGLGHPLAGQIKPWDQQPGNAAMLGICEILFDKCPKIKYISNDEAMPHGWDIADAEDWDAEMAKSYIRTNMCDYDVVRPKPEADEPDSVGTNPPITPPKQAPSTPPPPPPPSPNDDDDNDGGIRQNHFKFLGYDKGEDGTQGFYFYVNGSRKVIKLAATKMNTANLLTLAPLDFWEDKFPAKSNFSVAAAVNWIVINSNYRGIFSPSKIRGRGAWMDEGRVVVHAGNELIVDNMMTPLRAFKSRFIYEMSEELDMGVDAPLTTKQANRLMDMTSLINWEREANAFLLAGWCVIAPVCGALNWRSHIWLTGAAGTGKSWVFKKLVRKLLGNTALAVEGDTTEAGLRQLLGHDAMPVVFDEAEGEDRKSAERMQQVMYLMRVASSDEGGVLAKGTTYGSAKTYKMRSCFAFASIGFQASQHSDKSRVTVLGLRSLPESMKEEKQARWEKLQALYAEIMTDDFPRRLQARTLRLLPVILQNARIFANAAAAELGEQRAGDQLGSTLAGAYSLFSEGVITFEKAREWVAKCDWSEEKTLERNHDEMALLSHLLEQIIIADSEHGMQRRSVGELIMLAEGHDLGDSVTPPLARQSLRRIGFKVETINKKEMLVISNNANWVQSALKDTPWSKNHNKILMRLDGTIALNATHFATGIKTRAVALPLELVTGK